MTLDHKCWPALYDLLSLLYRIGDYEGCQCLLDRSIREHPKQFQLLDMQSKLTHAVQTIPECFIRPQTENMTFPLTLELNQFSWLALGHLLSEQMDVASVQDSQNAFSADPAIHIQPTEAALIAKTTALPSNSASLVVVVASEPAPTEVGSISSNPSLESGDWVFSPLKGRKSKRIQEKKELTLAFAKKFFSDAGGGEGQDFAPFNVSEELPRRSSLSVSCSSFLERKSVSAEEQKEVASFLQEFAFLPADGEAFEQGMGNHGLPHLIHHLLGFIYQNPELNIPWDSAQQNLILRLNDDRKESISSSADVCRPQFIGSC